MHRITGFVGRERELAEAAAALTAGHSVLVRGRPGIGRRAFLHQLRELMAKQGRVLLWPEMTTPKNMMHTLACQVHAQGGLKIPERIIPQRWRAQAYRDGRIDWRRIQRSLLREPVREVLAIVIDSIRDRDAIVFVETLEVPPTQAAALHALAEIAQLAAAMDADNRRARIQRLLWRFKVKIDLEPLTRAQVRQIVEQWLTHRPIEFDGPRVRKSFIRAVQIDSGGVPAAVEGMLTAASTDGQVTRSKVREYQHEAAAVYWDMTPVLVVVAITFMAMRYISRGLGMRELMVLAGVGSSLFYGLMFFVRRLSR